MTFSHWIKITFSPFSAFCPLFFRNANQPETQEESLERTNKCIQYFIASKFEWGQGWERKPGKKNEGSHCGCNVNTCYFLQFIFLHSRTCKFWIFFYLMLCGKNIWTKFILVLVWKKWAKLQNWKWIFCTSQFIATKIAKKNREIPHTLRKKCKHEKFDFDILSRVYFKSCYRAKFSDYLLTKCILRKLWENWIFEQKCKKKSAMQRKKWNLFSIRLIWRPGGSPAETHPGEGRG